MTVQDGPSLPQGEIIAPAVGNEANAANYHNNFQDTEAFLAAVGASKANCLLVDVYLGGISGIELGRGLAAAGFRFPIIYMTGSTDETVRARAMQAGCVAFLTKPLTPPALDEALMAARRKRRS